MAAGEIKKIKSIFKFDMMCELCNSCNNTPLACIPADGYEDSEIMVIAYQPNQKDSQSRRAFNTGNLEYIRKIIEEVIGESSRNVYYTYVNKCFTGLPDSYLEDEDVSICVSNYLKKEIELVQPKVIIALGESVSKLFTSLNYKKIRGKITKTEKIVEGVKLMTTYKPSTVYSDAGLELIAKDISVAIAKMYGVPDITQTVIADTLDLVNKAFDYCIETGFCCFDYETSTIGTLGLNDPNFFVTVLSISFQAGSSYVIPIEHKDSNYTYEEISTIFQLFKDKILENPDVRKLAHNADFDLRVTKQYIDFDFVGWYDDTMLMDHLIDETRKHGLKELVKLYFPKFANYDDEVSNFKWEDVPFNILCKYAAIDTDLTTRLYYVLRPLIDQDPRSYNIYRRLVIPTMKIFVEAEEHGMLVDVENIQDYIDTSLVYLNESETALRNHPIVARYEKAVYEDKIEAKLEELRLKIDKEEHKRSKKLEKKITTLKEKIASPRVKDVYRTRYEQQLIQLESNGVNEIPKTKLHTRYLEELMHYKCGQNGEELYEGLSLKSPKQLSNLFYFHPEGFCFDTLTGSTDKHALKELDVLDDTGFFSIFKNWRVLDRTIGTYLKPMRDKTDANGYIHTSFNLNGAKTGRISSRNPNLQNCPNPYKIKDDTTRSVVNYVKKSFIVPNGYTLVQVDFSQAELRLMAEFSRDETMIQLYKDGVDIHAATGAETVNISLEDFYKLDKKEQKEIRQKAKAVNFGFVFGSSAEGFRTYAKNDYDILLTIRQSEEIRTAFFNKYKGLEPYYEEVIAKASKYGWVRTLFGRRRQLPDIDSTNGVKRGADERKAKNSPIQGSNGEITLFAIVMMKKWLPDSVIFVNTIHDSLIYYVPDEYLPTFVKISRWVCANLPLKEYFGRGLKYVKMKVDVEVSKKSWSELEEIE